MKFEGSGKADREEQILMFNANITSADENGIVYDNENPTWTPIGEDNDEITREKNNEIDAKKNVLGKTNIDHTSGANTTEIDPIAVRRNDVLSYILYIIDKYDLVGDKAMIPCMEVSLFDKQGEDMYGAYTETAIIDQKSFGGDTTKVNVPITLNWKKDKVHGTYNLNTNKFTPMTTVAE